MSKRAVVLLGAGAPIAWGGPKTVEITNELFKSKEYVTKKSGQNLAEYVRDKLKDYYNLNDVNDINFEHIINALEALNGYVYEKAIIGRSPQLHGAKPLWFNLDNVYEEMRGFTFELITGQTSTGTYRNKTWSGGITEQCEQHTCDIRHLSSAIDHYLYVIRSQIVKYDDNCNSEKFNSLNNDFFSFYQHLKANGYTVRFYTTNYDELITKVFKKFNVSIFSGFDSLVPGHNYQPSRYFPNIKSILTDNDIECYYNLHGSAYWESITNYKNYEDIYSYSPGWPNPYDASSKSQITNPNEFTSTHNIVTGFNKLQKVSVEPLKSFFNALSFDSIKADLIITIGYSYSDPHINRCLRNGTYENNSKLLYITAQENCFGVEWIHMNDCTGKRKPYNTYCEIDNNKHFQKSNDNDVLIYSNGFENFLKEEGWKKLDLINI